MFQVKPRQVLIQSCDKSSITLVIYPKLLCNQMNASTDHWLTFGTNDNEFSSKKQQ